MGSVLSGLAPAPTGVNRIFAKLFPDARVFQMVNATGQGTPSVT